MERKKHQMICVFQGRQRAFGFMSVLGLLIISVTQAQAASQVTGIDFRGIDDPNRIEIHTNGPVTFEKQDNKADKQVVIELKGAVIQPQLTRKIDTSSFDSKVVLISPYQVEGQPDTVRVVIQLREAVDVSVVQEDQQILATIPVKGEPVSLDLDSTHSGNEGTASKTDGVTDPAQNQTTEEGALTPNGEQIKTFVNNRTSKKFTGKPIDLKVRDVDAADVFRLIGEASGFNIVLSDDVKGKLTLSLENVPWDEALEVVLKILGLTAERNRNILRIVSVKNYTQEKLDEARANEVVNAAKPRITRVFPISYASLDDLAQVITKMQSTLVGSTGSGADQNNYGSVQGAQNLSSPSASIVADKRTNSLVIRDTIENMERIKKLIEVLDIQTPQVLIEGKVVEVNESFSKQLAGNLGFSPSANSLISLAGGNPLDPLVGGVFANGAAIASQSAASGGTIGLGFLPGTSRLNAVLNLGESENKLKLVATPRVVVLNKEAATITQGTPTIVQLTTYQNGQPLITQQTQTANLTLNATPTVTNDGHIRLQLSLQRDLVANLSSGSAVAPRNLNTNVVVESGTTLVMGGIYTMSEDSTESGFPLLRKIPVLGGLFGKETGSSTRNELIFFITPQILNPKKGGFGGSSS